MKRLMTGNVRWASVAGMVLLLAGLAFLETVHGEEADWEEFFEKGNEYLEREDFDRAIVYYEMLVEKFPDVPEMRYGLGMAYYGKGHMDFAAEALEEAIYRDPRFVEAHFYLAMIDSKNGELRRVIKRLNTVIGIDGKYRSAYFNRGVAFFKMGATLNAMKDFAFALYLDPTDDSTFEALMKTYARMKMSGPGQYHDMGLLDRADVVPVKERLERVPEIPVVVAKEEKPEEETKGAVSISGKDAVKKNIIADEGPITFLLSEKGRTDIEVIFPEPRDLSGVCLEIGLKSQVPNMKVRYRVLDFKTRATPFLEMGRMRGKEDTFNIELESQAYMYVDTDIVRKIQFSFMPDAAFPPAGEANTVNIRLAGEGWF